MSKFSAIKAFVQRKKSVRPTRRDIAKSKSAQIMFQRVLVITSIVAVAFAYPRNVLPHAAFDNDGLEKAISLEDRKELIPFIAGQSLK